MAHETTGFYNRTAFRVLKDPLPEAFRDLDQHIIRKYSDIVQAWGSRQFGHAENLCRRYGDILLMRHHIEEALARDSLPEGAALGTSYLTAYLTSVEALLDVTAIVLNEVYQLHLSGGQLDLAKDTFWKRFGSQQKSKADRYANLKPWFKQVADRRNAAVHRVAPILITAGPGHPNEVDPSLTTVLMINRWDVEAQDLMRPAAVLLRTMIPPLDFVRHWHSKISQLVRLICEDLIST